MKTLYHGYSYRIIQVHYMIVLSVLEDYQLPTNNQLTLFECYGKTQYSWYNREQQPPYTHRDDLAWFLNYE